MLKLLGGGRMYNFSC